MSHYALDELIERWKREDLTPEQMIGQLLQLLHRIDERLRELERNTAPERKSGKAEKRRSGEANERESG